MNKPRAQIFYPALSGLRFVAASMVFFFHYHNPIVPSVPAWLARKLLEFHTGVAIFFVLSGFLVTCQYQHYTFTRSNDFLRYVIIWLGRIFPLYIPVFLELHQFAGSFE